MAKKKADFSYSITEEKFRASEYYPSLNDRLKEISKVPKLKLKEDSSPTFYIDSHGIKLRDSATKDEAIEAILDQINEGVSSNKRLRENVGIMRAFNKMYIALSGLSKDKDIPRENILKAVELAERIIY